MRNDNTVSQIADAVCQAKFSHLTTSPEEYLRDGDVQVFSFPQRWGDTNCGFGGVGGRALTDRQTTVVRGLHHGDVAVYMGSQFAYHLRAPTETFWEHVAKSQVVGRKDFLRARELYDEDPDRANMGPVFTEEVEES